MGNGVLDPETELPPPVAVRSVERALEPRYSAYLDEVQRLLRAGLEEITATGSVDPRVSDIVRRAGLSNKAFYRHFKSKDELLLAVLEEGMRTRMAEFEASLGGAGSATDRIRVWIEKVVEQAMSPELAAATRPLLVYQGRLLESLGEKLWTHTDRLKELVRDALRDGLESGELRGVDPVEDANLVYAVAMGWMHERVIAHRIPSREDADRVVAFAMHGLLHREERQGAASDAER